MRQVNAVATIPIRRPLSELELISINPCVRFRKGMQQSRTASLPLSGQAEYAFLGHRGEFVIGTFQSGLSLCACLVSLMNKRKDDWIRSQLRISGKFPASRTRDAAGPTT